MRALELCAEMLAVEGRQLAFEHQVREHRFCSVRDCPGGLIHSIQHLFDFDKAVRNGSLARRRVPALNLCLVLWIVRLAVVLMWNQA